MPLFKSFPDELDALRSEGWSDEQIKKWSVDDNGQPVERTWHNPFATGIMSAVRGAPAALTGTVAGIVAAPATGGLASIPIGMAVGAGTDALVGKMLPADWDYSLKESQFQNPKAAFAGGLGAAAAGGFRPSVTVAKSAIRALPRALSRYASEGNLVDPSIQAAKQLVGNTAIGALMPYAQAPISEIPFINPSSQRHNYVERVVNDIKNITPGEVAASAGTMALAHRPYKFLNKMAPKLFHDPVPDIQAQEPAEARRAEGPRYELTGEAAKAAPLAPGETLEHEGENFQPADQTIAPEVKGERAVNAPITPKDQAVTDYFVDMARRRGLDVTTQEGPFPLKDTEGNHLRNKDGDLMYYAGVHKEGPHALEISDVSAETGGHETGHVVLKNILRSLPKERYDKLQEMFGPGLAEMQKSNPNIDLEEYLATHVGRDLVRRLAESDQPGFASMMAGLRERLGRHTPEDVLRLVGDVTGFSGSKIGKPPELVPEGGRPIVSQQPYGPEGEKEKKPAEIPPYASPEYIAQLERLVEHHKRMMSQFAEVYPTTHRDSAREHFLASIQQNQDINAGMLPSQARARFMEKMKDNDFFHTFNELHGNVEAHQFDLIRARAAASIAKDYGEPPVDPGMRSFQPLDKPIEPEGEKRPNIPGRDYPYASKEHVDIMKKRLRREQEMEMTAAESKDYPGYEEYRNADKLLSQRLSQDVPFPEALAEYDETLRNNPYAQMFEAKSRDVDAIKAYTNKARKDRIDSERYGKPIEDPGLHFQHISKVEDTDPRVIQARRILEEHPALKPSEQARYTGVFKKEDGQFREFVGSPAEEMYIGRVPTGPEPLRNFLTPKGHEMLNKLPLNTRQSLMNTVVHPKAGASSQSGRDAIYLATGGKDPAGISRAIAHEVQHLIQEAQGLTPGVGLSGKVTSQQIMDATVKSEKAQVGKPRMSEVEQKEAFLKELGKVNPEVETYRNALGEREARQAEKGTTDADYQLISKVDDNDPRVIKAQKLSAANPKATPDQIFRATGVYQKAGDWLEFKGSPGTKFLDRYKIPAGKDRRMLFSSPLKGWMPVDVLTSAGRDEIMKLPKTTQTFLGRVEVQNKPGPQSGYDRINKIMYLGDNSETGFRHELNHVIQHAQGRLGPVGDYAKPPANAGALIKQAQAEAGDYSEKKYGTRDVDQLTAEQRNDVSRFLRKTASDLHPELKKYFNQTIERESYEMESDKPRIDYQFISKVDKDDPAIKEAYRMQVKGASQREIMDKLGIFKKEDGMWRRSLDNSAKGPIDYYDTHKLDMEPYGLTVRDYLSRHGSEVLDNLPKSARENVLDHTVRYMDRDMLGRDMGMHNGDASEILLRRGMPLSDKIATLTHEIQHAIQYEQKFPAQSRGSSISRESMGAPQKAADRATLVGKLQGDTPERMVQRAKEEYAKIKPREEYNANLGEREANKAEQGPKIGEHGEVNTGDQMDYQPLNFTGEVDRIRDPRVRRGVRKAFEKRPLLAGQFIKITRPLKGQDPALVEQVTDLHNSVGRSAGVLPYLAGQHKVISDILKDYARQTEAAGTGAGVMTARPQGELHVPNILSPDAVDVFQQGGPNSPVLAQAIVAEMIHNGASPVQAVGIVNMMRNRRTLHRDQAFGLPQRVTLPDGRTINVRDPFPYDRNSRLLASDIEWKRNVVDPTSTVMTPTTRQEDPAFRNSKDSYYGVYDKGGGLFRAYNRLAGAGFLQAWTGLKDFATTLPSARREGFSYPEIAKGLANIVKGRQSAIDKELIREEPYMIGPNPRTGTRHERWVNNAADFMYKASGRKMSDDWARSWAQAIADQAGRPEAAQYIAGIYDAREIPADLLKPGLLGEAFRINRWSISTANRLVKSVKAGGPGGGALKLGESFLLALGVGAGFDALRKKWSGLVKSRPELQDLRASGADSKHYVAWMSDLLQKGSFAGMYGDIVNGLVQAYVRGDYSKLQTFVPLVNSLGASFNKFIDTTRAALDHGEDPMKAISNGVNEATKDVIQNYRMIHDALITSKDEKQRRAEGRDLNIFRELTQDQRPGTYEAPNVAEGQAEKEYKNEMDVNKMLPELSKILTRYTSEYGNKPEKLVKKLSALAKEKTAIPSEMMELVNYYKFLEKRDGPKEALSRIEDLYKRQTINQIKSQVVPNPGL